MLVPLETLSGWPRVENPTVLFSLTLFVGIPLLIAVIVIALIEIGAKARARRSDNIDASDPLWVAAQESAELVPISDSKGAEAEAEVTAETSAAGVAAGTSAGGTNVEGDDTGSEQVGGAGARW
jgi:hypothetical protein